MNRRILCLLGLMLGLTDCSDSQSGAATRTPEDDGRADGEFPPGTMRDASTAKRDASTGAELDARRPTKQPAVSCTPGQYRGDFSCTIAELFPFSGDMTFTLVEDAEGVGEFTMLRVVPGTRIIGHDDAFEGTFDAELSGKFDCQTGQLMGAMNGSYLTPRLDFPIRMKGPLAGSYRLDGGAVFDGTMGPLESPDINDVLGPFAPNASSCTWEAARVGDVLDLPDAS